MWRRGGDTLAERVNQLMELIYVAVNTSISSGMVQKAIMGVELGYHRRFLAYPYRYTFPEET